MERSELLTRLGFAPPETCRVRVIIDTDAKNEGDDDFAILHHLLTPQFDVRGICATHFEVKTTQRGLPPHSMERSYQEVCRLLNAAHIGDVPVLHGCTAPLASPEDAPDCEAVEFLIQEALRDDPAPLYIAAQGAMTNIAAALNRAPEIAARMTVLWNGGGPYPRRTTGIQCSARPHRLPCPVGQRCHGLADPTGCLRQIRGIPFRIGASGTALRRSGSLSISAADGRVPLRIRSPFSSAHRGQLDFGRQHYRRRPAGEWIPGALDTPSGPCAPAQPDLC